LGLDNSILHLYSGLDFKYCGLHVQLNRLRTY